MTYLKDVQVYKIDIDNEIFKISNFPNVLTSGKNYFFISASDKLRVGSDIVIEIIDKDGNLIDYTVPDIIFNASQKIVVINIDDTFAYGDALVTILGELSDVPNSWKGKYNVKWQSTVLINPILNNISDAIFRTNPEVLISEFYDENRNITNKKYDTTIYSASVVTSQYIDFNYIVKSQTGVFNKEMIGGTLFISASNMNIYPYPLLYSASNFEAIIINVINSSSLITSLPYKALNYNTGIFDIVTFSGSQYSITYQSASLKQNTNVRNSYIKLQAKNIDTVGGSIRYIDINSKPENISMGRYEIQPNLKYSASFSSSLIFSNKFTFVETGSVSNIQYNKITNTLWQ